MAVLSSNLQQLYDDLQHSCPTLLPSILPYTLNPTSVLARAAEEGASSHQQLKEYIKAQSAACDSCHFCGGARSVPGAEAYHEAPVLVVKLQFEKKCCAVKHAGFCCMDCKRLSDLHGFVHGAASTATQSGSTRERWLQLCMHFACINKAADAVSSNPDAAAAWAQEVFCRAYSLQVLSSAISGWQLVGPDGQVVKRGNTGDMLGFLRACLAARPTKSKSVKGAGKTTPKSGQKRTKNSDADQSQQSPVSAKGLKGRLQDASQEISGGKQVGVQKQGAAGGQGIAGSQQARQAAASKSGGKPDGNKRRRK